MKNLQKSVFILVLLVLLGGYLYYQSGSGDDESWKTYTNNTYKYSIKYPANWSIDDDISHAGFVTIANYSNADLADYSKKNEEVALLPGDFFAVDVGFEEIDPKISLDAYLANPTFVKPTSSENITLAGNPAVKRTYLNLEGIGGATKPNQVRIFEKHGDKLISISYGFDDTNKSQIPIAEEIVNSFVLE